MQKLTDRLSAEDWRRPLPNPLAAMFAPGTKVRHLNPDLDWRGVITPEPETGQFLRSNDWSAVDSNLDEIGTSVYVVWDGHVASWYNVVAVAPVDAVDHAASIAVLGFSTRVRYCLTREGIRTVGDLLKQRPEDLTDIRNFGDVALAEVMATLGEQDPPLELQPTGIPLRAETRRVMAEIGDKS